jgi:alpha-glucosidase
MLGDVGWVKPGRAVRIRKPYSTEAALKVVAFAAARKLDYVEFDAHWYGDGTDPGDATVPIAGLDLQRIIDTARAQGIGMILYVDRVPAMRQRDAILDTYRRWGVAGIKFGFVWEGRQADNDFIFDLVKACGEYRLLVNLHDNLRPAGLERTLPNYVALEGVRGNEQFPTARHNVTLPFTRAVAGPIDYTICYANPKNQTTNGHQLAMAAVYYNPLTFLYWYDTPDKYAGRAWPDLRWFDECPTTWDETRALSGAIGEHVMVARRHGKRWFLGAMTNESPRVLKASLGFLGRGRWMATVFADGPAAAKAFETPVVIRKVPVTAATVLSLALAPSGGQAILFEPV